MTDELPLITQQKELLSFMRSSFCARLGESNRSKKAMVLKIYSSKMTDEDQLGQAELAKRKRAVDCVRYTKIPLDINVTSRHSLEVQTNCSGDC